MPESVLFVDDEIAVLDGYKRTLYRDFTVHTAVGGPAGLAAIHDKGPFAVIVSDMRMPGMSGAEFLSRVRDLAPHTVRMLLTGYSDMRDTAAAINDGNISRYLNKPCSKDDLVVALQGGVMQYRLAHAEVELLESTLLGSVRALAEILSAVNPEAFERSTRVSNTVRHLLHHALLTSPWQVEAAAMLSQLGCLALSSELLRAAHLQNDLPAAEQARFDAHPGHASDLIVHIPRMAEVGWIIKRQIFCMDTEPPASATPQAAAELTLAGEMLRLALDYDTLWLRGNTHPDIVFQLRQAIHTFPASLLDAIETMKPLEKSLKPARLAVSKLQEDMIVNEDVLNRSGALLVGGGQTITKALLMKLREYAEDHRIADEISVLIASV